MKYQSIEGFFFDDERYFCLVLDLFVKSILAMTQTNMSFNWNLRRITKKNTFRY